MKPKKQKPAPEWDAEMQALIKLFGDVKAPEHEFMLRAGHTVVSPERFHDSLRKDIEDGPIGPRATLGGLRKDLKCYLQYLTEHKNK